MCFHCESSLELLLAVLTLILSRRRATKKSILQTYLKLTTPAALGALLAIADSNEDIVGSGQGRVLGKPSVWVR